MNSAFVYTTETDQELGNIAAGIGTGASVGAAVGGPIGAGIGAGVGAIAGLLSKRGTRTCVEHEQEVKQAITKYLTSSDRAELVRGMDSNVAATPSAMARFFVGGKDCKHKNVGSGDQRFLDALPRRIEQRVREAEQPKQQPPPPPPPKQPPSPSLQPQSQPPSATAVTKAGMNFGTPWMIGLGVLLLGGVAWSVLPDGDASAGPSNNKKSNS